MSNPGNSFSMNSLPRNAPALAPGDAALPSRNPTLLPATPDAPTHPEEDRADSLYDEPRGASTDQAISHDRLARAAQQHTRGEAGRMPLAAEQNHDAIVDNGQPQNDPNGRQVQVGNGGPGTGQVPIQPSATWLENSVAWCTVISCVLTFALLIVAGLSCYYTHQNLELTRWNALTTFRDDCRSAQAANQSFSLEDCRHALGRSLKPPPGVQWGFLMNDTVIQSPPERPRNELRDTAQSAKMSMALPTPTTALTGDSSVVKRDSNQQPLSEEAGDLAQDFDAIKNSSIPKSESQSAQLLAAAIGSAITLFGLYGFFVAWSYWVESIIHAYCQMANKMAQICSGILPKPVTEFLDTLGFRIAVHLNGTRLVLFTALFLGWTEKTIGLFNQMSMLSSAFLSPIMCGAAATSTWILTNLVPSYSRLVEPEEDYSGAYVEVLVFLILSLLFIAYPVVSIILRVWG